MKPGHKHWRVFYERGQYVPVAMVGELRWYLTPRSTKRDARAAAKAFLKSMGSG